MKDSTRILLVCGFAFALLSGGDRKEVSQVQAFTAQTSECRCVDCKCGIVVAETKPLQAKDVSENLFNIRARGYSPSRQALYTNATAVSVGDGTFLTVAHLVDDMSPGYVVEVQIDGVWKQVNFRGYKETDAAVATLEDSSLPKLSLRDAEYGELLVVHGLKSNTAWNGDCVSRRMVALEGWQDGTIQGDSGGGVFDLDGTLVGIISGYLSDEKRVVTFVPIKDFETLLSQPNLAVSGQNCQNGVCFPATQQWRIRR